MNVAAARPAPANARPMRTAAGNASNAHHDSTRPKHAIVSRNTAEYTVPRTNAHATSPAAMSRTESGVASIASYVFMYLNFTKKLTVVSKIAPFIAAVASNAGATKWR